MNKLKLAIVSCGFLGCSPFAPGTVGTLLGVWIVIVTHHLDFGRQLGLALVMTLAAVPICHAAERFFARKDDGRIVADEYLTFPLCVLGLPWPEHPWLLAVAFATNRAMDILKPPPARQIQRLPGGIGIVADDAISCLYALGINHLVAWLAGRFLT